MGPKNDTRFKTGVSGNPKGRPKTLPEFHMMKDEERLSKQTVELEITKILNMKGEDILKIANDDDASGFKRIVAKIIHQAFESGDVAKFNLLLDRTAGPLVRQMNHAGQDGGPLRVFMDLEPDARKSLMDKLKERLGKK